MSAQCEMRSASVIEGAPSGAEWLDQTQRQVVREQLDRIMSSDAFRGSKRSREFLAHIVERALGGETDLLKERLIGVQLYGKDGAYDTSLDSTVRVRANEVRRRLLQYAEQFGRDEAFRIVLPSGSYIPEFRRAAVAEKLAPSKETAPSRLPSLWLMAPTLVMLALCGIAFRWMISPDSLFKQFWQPLLWPKRSLVLVVEPEKASEAGSGDMISLRKAGNLLRIDEICRQMSGQTGTVLTSRDELSPGGRSLEILVGETLQPTAAPPAGRLRYRIEAAADGPEVLDTVKSRKYRNAGTDPMQQESYALITRTVTSTDGPSTLALNGTDDVAISAAAELVSDEAALGRALKDVGIASMQKDLQILMAVQHSAREIWKREVLAVETYH